MKIIEMTATFGKLNGATLRPGPGFTLITAPNEGGKSTWCAFLRAMLYGFPPRDRDKGGYLAEKNRYQPWSGAAMEGTLTLEWQGRSLTLYRGPKGTVPWGSFSALWTATQESVPGLTAENCGETLLGVSREVFERTAFVNQGEMALSPSADLEKRVAALATSGEEDVSFSQVERRLKDWLNRRRVNNRVGLLPQLEEEIAQVEDTLTRQGSLLRQAQEAQQQKEALEIQRAALSSQLRSHAAAQRAQQVQNRRKAQAEYTAAQALLRAAQEQAQALPDPETLQTALGDLRYLTTLSSDLSGLETSLPQAMEQAEKARRLAEEDPCFHGQDPAQAASRAQRDQDQAQRLNKPRKSPCLILTTAALALLFSLYGLFRAGRSLDRLLLVGGVGLALLLLTAGVLFFVGRSRKKKLSALLAAYSASSPEEILSRSSAYQQAWTAAQEAQRTLQDQEAQRDKLIAQTSQLTAQLLRLVHSFAPEAATLSDLSAALSRALRQGEEYRSAQAKVEAAQALLEALPDPGPQEPFTPAAPPQGDPALLSAQLEALNARLGQISDEAARLQGQLRSMGDPAELEARRGQLLEQLSLRRGEYEAISAALESLKTADSLLRERFSPAVNQKAGEYFSALTGGRYDRASLTRQFQALAQEAGSPVSRQDLSLSGGAAQQLYLAARLAMCDLVLPGEGLPILLDDALDAFDDRRAKLALRCLLSLSQTRQILLFTCHSREGQMLAGEDITVLEG